MIARKVQSWMIRQKASMKSSKRLQYKKQKQQSSSESNGSIVTFDEPTKDNIYKWFGVPNEDRNQIMRCMISRTKYNHNKVGITNPFLHIDPTIISDHHHNGGDDLNNSISPDSSTSALQLVMMKKNIKCYYKQQLIINKSNKNKVRVNKHYQYRKLYHHNHQ